MPIHKIEAPNGRLYEFEAPEKASENDVYGYAKFLYDQDLAKEAKQTATAALKSGFIGGKGALERGIGTVLESAGAKGYAQSWLKDAAEAEKQAQEAYQPLTDEDLQRAEAENGILGLIGTGARKYVGHPLASMAGRFGPTMAASIAGGPVGLGAAGLNEYLASVGEAKERGAENAEALAYGVPLAALNVARVPTGMVPAKLAGAAERFMGTVSPEVAETAVREAGEKATQEAAARVAGEEAVHPITELEMAQRAAVAPTAGSEAAAQAASQFAGERTKGELARDVLAGTAGNIGVAVPGALAQEALLRAASGEEQQSPEEMLHTAGEMAALAPVFGAGHAFMRNPKLEAAKAAQAEAGKFGALAGEAQQKVTNLTPPEIPEPKVKEPTMHRDEWDSHTEDMAQRHFEEQYPDLDYNHMPRKVQDAWIDAYSPRREDKKLRKQSTLDAFVPDEKKAEEAKGVVDTHISDQEIKRANEAKANELRKKEQTRIAGEWDKLYPEGEVKFADLPDALQKQFSTSVGNESHVRTLATTGEVAPSKQTARIYNKALDLKAEEAKANRSPAELAKEDAQNQYNTLAAERNLPQFNDLHPDAQAKAYEMYDAEAGGIEKLTPTQVKDIAAEHERLTKPEVIEEPVSEETVAEPEQVQTKQKEVKPPNYGDTSVYDEGVTPVGIPEAEIASHIREPLPEKPAAPETAAPETAAPETTAPETTAPETVAPETTAPEYVWKDYDLEQLKAHRKDLAEDVKYGQAERAELTALDKRVDELGSKPEPVVSETPIKRQVTRADEERLQEAFEQKVNDLQAKADKTRNEANKAAADHNNTENPTPEHTDEVTSQINDADKAAKDLADAEAAAKKANKEKLAAERKEKKRLDQEAKQAKRKAEAEEANKQKELNAKKQAERLAKIKEAIEAKKKADEEARLANKNEAKAKAEANELLRQQKAAEATKARAAARQAKLDEDNAKKEAVKQQAEQARLQREANEKAEREKQEAYDADVATVAKLLKADKERIVHYDPETKTGLYTVRAANTGETLYAPFKLINSDLVNHGLYDINAKAMSGYLSDKQEKAFRAIANKLKDESFAQGDLQMQHLFGDKQIAIRLSDKPIGDIAKSWAAQLGLDRLPNGARVFITDSAAAKKLNLKGSLETVGIKEFFGGEHGIHIPLLDRNNKATGDYAIVIDHDLKPHEALEVLSHEMGHTVEKTYLNGASKEVKNAIQKDFLKYLQAHSKAANSHEIAKLFYPPALAKGEMSRTAIPRDKLNTYTQQFGEWFANQTAKWATSAEKPVSVVDKFFAALGKILRDFFGANKEYLPENSVKEFLDNIPKQILEGGKPIEDAHVQKAQSINSGAEDRLLDTKYTTLRGEPEKVELMDKVKDFTRKFIDEWSGLEEKLAPKLGRITVNGKLRADLLGHAYSQLINSIHATIQRGGFRISSDGTIMAEALPFTRYDGKLVNASLPEMQRIMDEIPKGREILNTVAYVLDTRAQLARDPSKVGKHITDDMAKFKQAEADVATLRAQYPQINDALKMWRKVNSNLIEQTYKSGLINKATRDMFAKEADYFPRYMIREELMDRMGVNDDKAVQIGNTHTKIFRERTAAEHQVNIWENMARHIAGVTSAISANELKRTIAEQLKETGNATFAPNTTNKALQGNLAFMQDGKRVFYKVDDPNIIPPLMVIQQQLGPLMKSFRGAANVLRFGALNNPAYWLRQIVRDPIQASLSHDIGWITPAHTMRELAAIARGNSPIFEKLVDAGIIGHVDPTIDVKDMTQFMREIGKPYSERSKLTQGKDYIVDKSMRIHTAVDGATRVAVYKNVYDRAIKAGKSVKAAEAEALMQARESINFAIKGSHENARTARLLIPFLSAGINGLRLLQKSMTAQHIPEAERAAYRKQFMGKVALMGMMSGAYAMMMAGNEDYENAVRDQRRYANWLVPTGDKEHPFINVSLPPEYAFLKWVPEMMVRYSLGTQGGKELMGAAGEQLKSMVPGGLAYTGGMPVPQLMRPALDVAYGVSSYTGEPIESQGESHRPVEKRGEHSASETAKFLSSHGLSKVGLSPAKLDHLFRGYGAELGMAAVALVDQFIPTQPTYEKQTKDISQVPGLGLRGIIGSRYESQARDDFYEHKNDADQWRSEVNKMINEGRPEDAKALLQDPEVVNKYKIASVMDKLGKEIQTLNNQIKIIEANPRLSQAQRDAVLDRMRKTINAKSMQGEKIWKQVM